MSFNLAMETMEHGVEILGNSLPHGETSVKYLRGNFFPLEPTKLRGVEKSRTCSDFMGYDHSIVNSLMFGSVLRCVYTLGIGDFKGGNDVNSCQFFGVYPVFRKAHLGEQWVNWKDELSVINCRFPCSMALIDDAM